VLIKTSSGFSSLDRLPSVEPRRVEMDWEGELPSIEDHRQPKQPINHAKKQSAEPPKRRGREKARRSGKDVKAARKDK
jgi:hypothetical protein